MKSIRRFLAILMTLALLAPAVSLSESGAQEIPEEEGFPQEEGVPEDWEAAETAKKYEALSMWLGESEGQVNLYDTDGELLELEEDMRFSGGTVLETEEESLAIVGMDRKKLAVMDEISRAGFDKMDNGNRISITLQSGAMYFRVAQPLEKDESFDVVMDDIRLAIRGTCGMVQRTEDGITVVLACGHAVITREPEAGEDAAKESGEESEEITIEAGESVSVAREETGSGIRFEKKKLTEEEVPAFLTEVLMCWDPMLLERVIEESGWNPETLFGEGIWAAMTDNEDPDPTEEEFAYGEETELPDVLMGISFCYKNIQDITEVVNWSEYYPQSLATQRRVFTWVDCYEFSSGNTIRHERWEEKKAYIGEKDIEEDHPWLDWQSEVNETTYQIRQVNRLSEHCYRIWYWNDDSVIKWNMYVILPGMTEQEMQSIPRETSDLSLIDGNHYYFSFDGLKSIQEMEVQ